MKYTSPIYKNEAVETNDIICESIFTVINRQEVEKDNEGNVISTKNITQISVDMGKLF